jgi:hypothetical protein
MVRGEDITLNVSMAKHSLLEPPELRWSCHGGAGLSRQTPGSVPVV